MILSQNKRVFLNKIITFILDNSFSKLYRFGTYKVKHYKSDTVSEPPRDVNHGAISFAKNCYYKITFYWFTIFLVILHHFTSGNCSHQNRKGMS